MERLHPASGNLVDDYQIKSDYYEVPLLSI